jgi:methylmalonyl-CoA mutase
VYADLAEATAEALKQAGARRVYLAGKGDYPGVDEYVHLGVDALDILTRAEAVR